MKSIKIGKTNNNKLTDKKIVMKYTIEMTGWSSFL